MDDCIRQYGLSGDSGMGPSAPSMAGLAEAAKEAVQALVALGYTNTEASRAVKQVEVQMA